MADTKIISAQFYKTIGSARKFSYVFFLLIFLGGCSTVTTSSFAVKGSSADRKVSSPAASTGLAFAKTVFEGIVKASYVQLTIGNQADEKKIYQLVVGDKDRQRNFPWNVQTVESGYFFIELPQGQYRIRMISIPTGTTMASEPMDVVFDIQPEKALYLGTLKVIGTKEKVKLGGVPVIQPGFEYTVEILSEQADALREFRQHFSGSSKPVEINLMRVNASDNRFLETNAAVQK